MKEDGIIIKVCPRCKKEFWCYQGTEKKCWCDDFIVSPDNLKLLTEKYNNCLCPDCLALYGKKKK